MSLRKVLKPLTWAVVAVFTFTSGGTLWSLSVEALSRGQGQSGGQAQPAPETGNEFSGKVADEYQKPQAIYKDPRLACLLSFVIPGGGGHFYLRSDVKGALFCTGVAIGYLAAAYFVFSGFLPGNDPTGSNLIIGAIAGLIGVVVHIVAMVEAYNDAVQINESKFFREY